MAKPELRAEILEMIRGYMAEHGYGPTVREIGAAVGLRSTASVYYQLQRMAETGMILLNENKKRSISLPVRTEPGQVPLVGVIAAGQPILARENIEGYLQWDGALGWYALRVKGDSMINAGILNGDVVVIRPQSTAENGEIVAALIDDEATVKRLMVDKTGAWLLPENDAYAPIDGSHATILGLVKGVVRRY